MKRRDFLAITGAGVAAAVAPDIGYKLYWEKVWKGKGYRQDWKEVPTGVEQIVTTVCQQCQGGCGAVVRIIGERAVKIDGNPRHPVSRGGLCPKGQSALQALYHPSRISSPMKRTGPRGSGEWQNISWDEAIAMVLKTLREIRDRRESHTVAFIDGEESNGLMRVLIKRFLESYGSPNYIAKSSSQSDELLMKSVPLDGREGFYDISKANYVLSFGFNFIEAFYSPLQGIQAYSKLRDRGAKITYVGSRLSVTGIKSDEWIKVNPGTEGLLAIGMAQVIINERLYKNSFVVGRTSKFEGYKAVVLSHSLREISEVTGVPEETIKKIAREFAALEEFAVAIGNAGTLANQVAVNSLNLLTGSIANLWWDYDENAIPFTELPKVEQDSTASQSMLETPLIASDSRFSLAKHVFGLLPDRIIAGNPYPVNALFIYYSNPLISVPNAQKMKEALAKVPFIVNFSPFMDETAQISDIILPDHSPFEKLQDAPQTLIDGTPVLGLRRPIMKPGHNTMETGDVLIKMAQKFGEPLHRALSWKDYTEFLMVSLQGVFDSKEGSIVDGRDYAKFEDWVTALAESAWWNPERRKIFERVAEFNSDLVSRVATAESKPEEYPFHLNVYKLMTLSKPRNTAQPTLFDIAAPHISRKWVAWVEINPEAAHELGIHDEDWVWVESHLGRDKFKAKIYEGTLPEVVNIPLIVGSKGYAPWSKKVEQNPLSFVEDVLDAWDGHYMYNTRVKIYKV